VRTEVSVSIRPYEDEDEGATVDLLSTSLGGGPAGRRTAEFFRWKHIANPFGRSFMLLAEADGRIVGLRAFLRWRFVAGGRTFSAVRAVDTATHPELQGRGIFSRLTVSAIDALRGEADFVFNTPNEKSLPGYLKMGWRVVGRVPVAVRPCRPVRMFRNRKSLRSVGEASGLGPPIDAAPASEALRDAEGLSLLVAAHEQGRGLSTLRDLDYLRWRYGSVPDLDYRAVSAKSEGRTTGIVIFRVRPRGKLWETTISELLVDGDDAGTAVRLLVAARRAADVDHLTCSFPARSAAARAARRSGFVPAPGGVTLTANPLRGGIEPDPTALASWSLSLGDVEVF
jgi:GNAT superfamily N-acetyltransferase